MYIDWMTWSIWALGLALLLYWCVQTLRELKSLFSRQRGCSASSQGTNGPIHD